MRKHAALLVLLAVAASAQRLLLTSEDFERIARTADAQAWAASVRTSIIQAAEAWPAAHNQRYGLGEWAPPPEGGQWTLWYICKVHGVYLQYRGPGQNLCPVDGQNWTGWPYDQVVYAYRHTDSANAARDNGLAYRLTGRIEFARAAARILLAYADVYNTYPIKDVNNRPDVRSGARVGAQTLDEANWIIPVAWAYDLIAGSGALDPAERAQVEKDLLRATAGVIARYNAGKSNWQSWHNAGIGAVGFALQDQELISQVIDGPGGFRDQMRQSIFNDGVWYEGAWGYHFYALDPLRQLAEMAARAGIDLWSEPPLRKMFEAPLKFALPDGTLPNFNDSGNVSVFSNNRMYENAWRRYEDPVFASVLGRQARGRDALFWGAESLPAGEPPQLASTVFEDSGNAILRAAGSDHYLAFKFGPHGGGHGHYDKLNFISYARSGMMAVDPGTQSYAAATHNTWDKLTVAHNTVVVDERTQAEATGRLLAFASLPSISAARAEAGPAYRQAALERALVLTPEYALDLFDARSTDGAEHRFDWVYHNFGALSTPLARQPHSSFPQANGYQHLTGTQAATTGEAWQATFDMNQAASPNYGSTWPSVSSIKATFTHSREQAASGRFSGRMGYDFSESPGYILFSTPALAGQPAEVPQKLSVMIHGDNSGHRLALRFYDATDERFVYTVGPVNWTGWREVTASDPARWSHYLGNNDGVIDTPVKTVAVELTFVAGGPAQGALYADDIAIEYPAAGRTGVTGFERLLRSLRAWVLGAPDTTVVTGDGLGPNLLQPVPFVMARRRGTEARFAALLEPFGDSPGVKEFRALPDGWFQVSAGDFDDRVSFEGALRFVRREQGALRRLALSGDGTLAWDGAVLLEADAPAQVDYSGDGSAIAITTAAASVKVLAPSAREVTLNGAPVEFRREGEYCIIAAWP